MTDYDVWRDYWKKLQPATYNAGLCIWRAAGNVSSNYCFYSNIKRKNRENFLVAYEKMLRCCIALRLLVRVCRRRPTQFR